MLTRNIYYIPTQSCNPKGTCSYIATPKFLLDKQFSYEPEPATIRGQDFERNTVNIIDLFMQLPLRKKFSPALPLIPLKIPKLVPYFNKDFGLLDIPVLFLLACHT